MRASDKMKKAFRGSHDKQIKEDLHDEIVLWIYRKSRDVKFLIPIIGKKNATAGKIVRTLEAPLGGHTGFIDLKVSVGDQTWRENSGAVALFVEVKTAVNIGETLRQINYYKQILRGASYSLSSEQNYFWAVCAPMFSEFEVLEEQGVYFIPYPEGEDFL